MRESFVFYKSFFDSIEDLDDKSQLELYRAICKLAIYSEEIELTGISKTLFTLIKPQIEANTKKYNDGKLGGRPKKEKTTGFEEEKPLVSENKNHWLLNEKTTGSKNKKPNVNVNDNENVNVNVNDNENVNENDNENVDVNLRQQPQLNSIYDYLESNFGYTISPIVFEKMEEWQKVFSEDVLKFAIDKCCYNNARNFNYLDAILKSWKSKGYKKLEECKNENLKKEPTPDWFDKKIEKKEVSEDERKEIEEIMKGFK